MFGQLKSKIQNLVRSPQRWMANYLRRRGWVVFFLEESLRYCSKDVCWMNIYQAAEKRGGGEMRVRFHGGSLDGQMLDIPDELHEYVVSLQVQGSSVSTKGSLIKEIYEIKQLKYRTFTWWDGFLSAKGKP